MSVAAFASHRNRVSETPAATASRLQSEAVAATNVAVVAFVSELALFVRACREMSDLETAPAGIREIASRMAADLTSKAQSIEAIRMAGKRPG